MKFIKDRQELAQAINFDGIPVLTVDVRNCMPGYPHCYSGSKVNVLGGRTMALPTHCTVNMYGDEPGNQCHDMPWFYKTIDLMNFGSMLHRDFTLKDADEMVAWANARTVCAGDSVILYFRAENEAYFRVMKVSEQIDPRCSTVASLVDID